MKHSIIDNLKRQIKLLSRFLSDSSYTTNARGCLKRTSLGLFAIFLLSSAVVGCGLNKNSRFGSNGYGRFGGGPRHIFGQSMPGQHIIDIATGYNMNGHEIQLEFVSFTQGYGFNSVNLRNGPYWYSR